MTKCSKLRAATMGLVLSSAISMPSLAAAQMAGGMGHDKMMPMGDGKMGADKSMPKKKMGCCGKMGGMKGKPSAMAAKSHKHGGHAAKAKPAATAQPMPAKPMKDM